MCLCLCLDLDLDLDLDLCLCVWIVIWIWIWIWICVWSRVLVDFRIYGFVTRSSRHNKSMFVCVRRLHFGCLSVLTWRSFFSQWALRIFIALASAADAGGPVAHQSRSWLALIQ